MPEPSIKPNLNITLTCPDCKLFPPELIEAYTSGDIICASCGLVICDRIIDQSSEWRTFNEDPKGTDMNRVGDAINPLFNGFQLQTFISSGEKNSKALNKTQHSNYLNKQDDDLQIAFDKISQMCGSFDLAKIVEDATKEIYKICYKENSLRGKSQEAIISACLIIGCRKADVGRSFKEIWALTKVPKKEIGRTFKIMKKILQSKGDNKIASSNPEDLIRRFCLRLNINNKIIIAAEYIAKKVKELDILIGRSPTTIAASVIYLAAIIFKDITLTRSKVSNSVGISEGTIRNCVNLLQARKEELMNPLWEKQNGMF